MLREHQVRFLLQSAERLTGRELTQIRGKLRSKTQVRHAIWELVLLDAASRLGKVEYEPLGDETTCPDILVNVSGGGVWLEAAYLEPRHADVLARQEAFTLELHSAAKERGMDPYSFSRDFYGAPAAFGADVKLPQAQELKRFFRRPAIRAFFDQAAVSPRQRASIDLGPEGATAIVTFDPRPRGDIVVIGGGPVVEAPRRLKKHALYRVLDDKGAHYADTLTNPLIVCVVTEQNPTMGLLQPPSQIPETDAVDAAFKRRPLLSGVMLVSIEQSPSVFGLPQSRRARSRMYFNNHARYPLTDEARSELKKLQFDNVDWGTSWNEWEGAATADERASRIGGMMTIRHLTAGFVVTLPVKKVVGLLGGLLTPAELLAEYRESENAFQRAAIEDRQLVRVTLLPHDPRGAEPAMIELEFGPPTALLLQVPQRKT